MTLALLCSGQGHQHRAMFALTGAAPEAEPVFAAASRVLGRDPRRLVEETDAGALHANRTGQILCCTQALAAVAALREQLPPRLVVAGYSVGELASWGCARLLAPEHVIDLAARRAEVMDAASGPDDRLAFVRGLARPVVDALCRTHGAAVAIINPGDLYVVGGVRDALRGLCTEAHGLGASRAGLLDVFVASHTPALASAATAFRMVLQTEKVASQPAPGLRLLSGIDGMAIHDTRRGFDKLAAQIAQAINWAACLEACVESGVDAFIELGPGTALSAMVAAAYPNIKARALDDFRSLEGVKAWLGRSAGQERF